MAGTQSIDRAIQLLKHIARRGKTGWVLADLAAECGLHKGTAHRILNTLVQNRFVERHTENRHYRPGPLLFELALSRPDSFAQQQRFEEPLARLAARLKAVCFVSLRSDTDGVIAAKASSLPIKGVQVEVGARRPLILTAGGISMLLALPRAEADRIISCGQGELRRTHPHRVAAVNRLLERSRRAGFGFAQGDIIRDTIAIGIPIHDEDGLPFASICVASTAEYLPENIVPAVTQLLREEAGWIEAATRAIEMEKTEKEVPYLD